MKCLRRACLLCLAGIMVLSTLGTPAIADVLTAALDPSAVYAPTQIVNGDFTTEPWMDYRIGSTIYTELNPYDNEKDVDELLPNGVGGGWNTTENRTWNTGTLFEYNWNSGLGRNGDGGFIEMNLHHSAVFYQDLTTKGGDVVKWTLQHCSRPGYGDTNQIMYVQIGAPEMSSGSIVPASGINSDVNAHIQSATRGTYTYTGITEGAGTVAFANTDDLTYLRVAQSNSAWNNVRGVYVVPEGQTVTRFAFIATGSTPDGGNLLDNITFSTLIGNLSAGVNSDGSVTVKGYWGDTDTSKKLIIKIGSTEKTVDMSAVCGNCFTVDIPASEIGSATQVEVYHQDYEGAKRTVKLTHTHSWAYEGSGATLTAWCANTMMSEGTCSYQGKANGVQLTISVPATEKTYDGTPVTASLSDDTAWKTALGTVPDIQYYRTGDAPEEADDLSADTSLGSGTPLTSAPSDPGVYSAEIAAGGETAQVAFTINKVKQTEAPTTVVATKPSKSGGSDGTITGLDDTMEISDDGGATWHKVPTGVTEVTGLPEGNYMVRYAGTEQKSASPILTINLTYPVATGDTTPVMILMALLCVSLVMGSIVLKKKKAE